MNTAATTLTDDSSVWNGFVSPSCPREVHGKASVDVAVDVIQLLCESGASV